MPRIEIPFEDMDKLIDLVRRNPVLYDSTHKDYKDSTHSESTWNRIAKQMGRQNMAGYDWRKKWVNRRDTYVKKKRQIRLHRSAAEVERAKRWRFFDSMAFLDRFVEGASDSAECNATNEDDSSEAMSGDEDGDESTNISTRQKSDSRKRPAPSPSPCPIHSTNSKKKPPDPDSGSNADEFSSDMPVPCPVTFNGADDIEIQSTDANMNNATMAEQNNMEEPPLADGYPHQSWPHSTRVTCPDYHLLFQSYAHRLERLPDRTQSFIQFQIAQLFFNAENRDLAPMAIVPLPPMSALPPSSSSSSPSRQQRRRRRLDDFHDRQQQTLPHHEANTNLESRQRAMRLELDNDDSCGRTCICTLKTEIP